MVVLHATDPATVYLSVLARCRELTVSDVAAALYSDRSLVRMMAMRRTLFVVPSDLVAVVHHGASLEVAATIRRRLLGQLATLPTEPELPDDLAGWLADVEASVEAILRTRGSATGSDLSAAEPRLRTAILPTSDKTYDVRRTITTQVLTLMAAEGRIVRTEPRGSWLSRHHTWEPADRWWPEGIADLEPSLARVRLVEAYLGRFGPATEADIAWWTGWSLGPTRAALAAADLQPVELDGGSGWVRAGDVATVGEQPTEVAALLPALDPTPMGWKQRAWFLPTDATALYDRNGNIGPTVWWAGEVVGAWAVRADGSLAVRMLVDRGRAAVRAVAEVAERMQARIGGVPVVPSFPAPLETELRHSHP